MLLGLTLFAVSSPTGRQTTSRRGDVASAEDASIGIIVETLALGDDRYVVVDTRQWTSGSRRLLPVSAIDRIDLNLRRCYTSLERDAIRRAPDFDPFQVATSRYRNVLRNYFDGCRAQRDKTNDCPT